MQAENQVETKAGVNRKRVKPMPIKEKSLAAGLAAFQALESLDVVPRPAVITARTLVEEGIESIMKARARGVSLLRIYNDAKKAAGLRVSFQTFAGYVCAIAKEKGLRLEKKQAAPVPGASTPVAPALAHVPVVEQQKEGWNCGSCETSSQRHESQKRPGVYFWRCSKCGQAYADQDGTMSDQKL